MLYMHNLCPSRLYLPCNMVAPLTAFYVKFCLPTPLWGLIYMIKADVSDGFYRIDLRPGDAPNFRLVFSGLHVAEEDSPDPLVAISLTLSMGWKNSPPVFCAATETVTDLANASLRAKIPT